MINLYQYDCVVVDITLPDGSGLDVIKNLKKIHSSAGVVIISAKNALDDKINGLTIGADDYLTKPFHLAELNARIKAVVRRRQFDGEPQIEFNEIVIKPEERQVLVKNKSIQTNGSLVRAEQSLKRSSILGRGSWNVRSIPAAITQLIA